MQHIKNLFTVSCTAFGLKITLTQTKVMFTPVTDEPYIKPIKTVHGISLVIKKLLFNQEVHCDTMRCNSFPFVLVPLRRSLRLFWRETHTKGLRTRYPTRPEVEKGRKAWEKTEKELTKQGRRDQSAWDSCPENDTVSRRRQWEDGGRPEKRVNRSQKGDCYDLLTYRGRVNQREMMSALSVAL